MKRIIIGLVIYAASAGETIYWTLAFLFRRTRRRRNISCQSINRSRHRLQTEGDLRVDLVGPASAKCAALLISSSSSSNSLQSRQSPRISRRGIMQKLTDKIAALPQNANYFSLEFFPPKTQMVGYPAFAVLRAWLTILSYCRVLPISRLVWNVWRIPCVHCLSRSPGAREEVQQPGPWSSPRSASVN